MTEERKKIAREFLKRAEEMDNDPKMFKKSNEFYEKTTTRIKAKLR